MKGRLGNQCLTRFMAPIPEAIFLVSFSMRQFQLSLSSIVTPSDSELKPVPSTNHCD